MKIWDFFFKIGVEASNLNYGRRSKRRLEKNN